SGGCANWSVTNRRLGELFKAVELCRLSRPSLQLATASHRPSGHEASFIPRRRPITHFKNACELLGLEQRKHRWWQPILRTVYVLRILSTKSTSIEPKGCCHG